MCVCVCVCVGVCLFNVLDRGGGGMPKAYTFESAVVFSHKRWHPCVVLLVSIPILRTRDVMG